MCKEIFPSLHFLIKKIPSMDNIYTYFFSLCVYCSPPLHSPCNVYDRKYRNPCNVHLDEQYLSTEKTTNNLYSIIIQHNY